MFALVLISPAEPDPEAEVARLIEPHMQRGIREWWTIGGRYDGVVQTGQWVTRPLEERALLANNRCPVSQLPAGLPVRAVVTPDGKWHEGPTSDDPRETSGLAPAELEAFRRAVAAWAQERAELLSDYRDSIAIGVDYGVWL